MKQQVSAPDNVILETAPVSAADSSSPPEKANPDKAEKARQENPGVNEVGGPKGLEPTRYGDWEKAGRCIDF